jgi:hypothetical protein
MKNDKYRRILIILGIIILVIFNEYRFTWSPTFFVEKDQRALFSKIPGAIDLKVITGDKSLLYEIKNGNFVKKQSLPFPPNYFEQRTYNQWFDKQEQVKGEDISGYIYTGPYSINNENTFSVFSLSSANDREFPKYILIVNWETKTNVALRNIDNNIVDIVWSPDSKMFAVLERLNGGPPVSILATIAAAVGHPPSMYSYFVSIFDTEGTLIAHSKISNRILISSGQLYWNYKKI